MHSAPATQSEKLKEFSLRLTQAVEADCANWRLPAWLVAMIVAFVNEIVETLTELAKLLREGKIPLPAAPRQGTKRRAGTPTKRSAAARQARSPRPAPEAAEQPAMAWRTQLLCDAPESGRRTAPIPPAPPPEPPSTVPTAERLRRGSIPLASGSPARLPAWDKHLSWHALNVSIS